MKVGLLTCEKLKVNPLIPFLHKLRLFWFLWLIRNQGELVSEHSNDVNVVNIVDVFALLRIIKMLTHSWYVLWRRNVLSFKVRMGVWLKILCHHYMTLALLWMNFSLDFFKGSFILFRHSFILYISLLVILTIFCFRLEENGLDRSIFLPNHGVF